MPSETSGAAQVDPSAAILNFRASIPGPPPPPPPEPPAPKRNAKGEVRVSAVLLDYGVGGMMCINGWAPDVADVADVAVSQVMFYYDSQRELGQQHAREAVQRTLERKRSQGR